MSETKEQFKEAVLNFLAFLRNEQPISQREYETWKSHMLAYGDHVESRIAAKDAELESYKVTCRLQQEKLDRLMAASVELTREKDAEIARLKQDRDYWRSKAFEQQERRVERVVEQLKVALATDHVADASKKVSSDAEAEIHPALEHHDLHLTSGD